MSFSLPANANLAQGNIFSAGLNVAQQGVQIISKPINTTRILLLSEFAPELKTRDVSSIFAEYEDMNGGYRIKWIDDRSAYIVFSDASTAKKAFLATLSNPPPSIASSIHQKAARIAPYNGPDADTIIQSVANRPRSRSIAAQGATSGHVRRASASSITAIPPNANALEGRRSSVTFTNPVKMNGATSSEGSHQRTGSTGFAEGLQENMSAISLS